MRPPLRLEVAGGGHGQGRGGRWPRAVAAEGGGRRRLWAGAAGEVVAAPPLREEVAGGGHGQGGGEEMAASRRCSKEMAGGGHGWGGRELGRLGEATGGKGRKERK